MSTSFKAVLRPALRDGTQPVAVRFTAGRTHAFFQTGVCISKIHWNEAGKLENPKWVRRTHSACDLLNAAIQRHMRQAQQLVLDHPHAPSGELRDRLAGKGPAAAAPPADFLTYFAQHVARRAEQGHPRTAEKFASILHKVRVYLAGPPPSPLSKEEEAARLAGLTLPFEALSVRWVRDYEAYLATLGNKESTINKELSFLNTVLRQAVEEDKLEHRKNPFTRLRLKRPKPAAKVKLTEAQVQQLEALPLPTGQVVTLARECWLLQYFLLGSRVGDAVTVRWRDVHADRVEFHEHKTGKLKIAPRHPRLDVVLTRLRGHHQRLRGAEPGPADFVLPFLRADQWYTQWPEGLTWSALQNSPQYRPAWVVLLKKIESVTSMVNQDLRRLPALAGIDVPALTSHTARHSFADAGRRLGVSTADLRDMLNHHSIAQTEAYMGQLEKSEASLRARLIYEPAIPQP